MRLWEAVRGHESEVMGQRSALAVHPRLLVIAASLPTSRRLVRRSCQSALMRGDEPGDMLICPPDARGEETETLCALDKGRLKSRISRSNKFGS